MQKVKCIKAFWIDKCDDDGRSIENEYIDIEEGVVLEVQEDNFRFIGGEVRLIVLDNNTPFEWLELSKETFEKHFEIIEKLIKPDKRYTNSAKFRYIKEHNNYDLTIGKIYPGYIYNSEWIYIAEDDNYNYSLYRKECFEISN